MAREDVNIKVSANVAEAIQLWKAMEKGPEGMANALDAMGQKGQKSTKGMGEEIIGFVGKWASVGAAVSAVTALINQQYEALKKLREERNATTNTIDEEWSKFQVQSSIPNGTQATQVRTQLLSIIANRKIAPVQGLSAATQLGSAGASVPDITGGGLDEFLKMVTAANSAGRDVNMGELAKATVLFLKANGLQPNREGMSGTSLAIQQLFGGTNLQVSNLARFAPEAGTIAKSSGLKPTEQLGIYSQFLDTMEESRAAIAFRTGVQRMATAGGTPERVRALADIGLKPEDVDFVGEDYWTATERLRKGFSGAPKNIQNIVAQRLFGDEGMGFYNVLMQPGGLEESRKRVGMATNQAGAAERLQLAESSRGAAARQAETLAAYGVYDATSKDPKVIENRLKALLGILGASEQTQASILGEWDDIPFWPDAFSDQTPEGKARRAAKRLASPDPRFQFSRAPRERRQDDIYQQLIGERPIRILGPDGLDIPTEPAAAGLGQ